MFRKITLLDNIILFPEQYIRLGSCAKTVELGLGLSTEEIEKRIRLFESTGAKVDCITECGSERLEQPELLKKLADTECLITCWQPLTRPVLQALSGRLKLVLYWTDAVRADVEAAHEYGIIVDNIPDYGTHAVSEYVFACLLEMLRRPSHHRQRAHSGSFDYENFKTARKGILMTEEINEETLIGKKLGIAGFGRIGQRVGRIGQAGFDMEVTYFSRSQKKEADELSIPRVSLDEMFRTSDIVTCHFPSSVRNPVIGRDLLSLLRPDSIFINTGGPESVDYEALIEMLEAGRFKAILDVHPRIPDRKRLNQIPNLFYTYRSAWYTKQSLWRKGQILMDKLERYSKTLGIE
jgi:lactate dehydrogenase-like 2-hydroxyacid dehydrogenase